MANQTEINLHIQDVLYTAVIHHYQRYCPMRITGSGFGDAEPPEEEEIDFTLYLAGNGEVTDEATIADAERQLLNYYRSK